MSIVAYRELCDPCKEWAEGIVDNWTCCVENALVNYQVFSSLEGVQKYVNDVWKRELVASPSPQVLSTGRTRNAVTRRLVRAWYDAPTHQIFCAEHPIEEHTVLHELSHALVACKATDTRERKFRHGTSFVRFAFGLYQQYGLVGSSVNPMRFVASVESFEEEAIDRTKCALLAGRGMRVRRAMRRVLPARLTKH